MGKKIRDVEKCQKFLRKISSSSMISLIFYTEKKSLVTHVNAHDFTVSNLAMHTIS